MLQQVRPAIRTLKQIEAEGRLATPEEQETLSRYVGWGGIAGAFDQNDPKWAKEYAELKELLTPEEYASARASLPRRTAVSDRASALHRTSYIPHDTVVHVGVLEFLLPVTPGQAGTPPAKSSIEFRFFWNLPCFIAYFYADCQGTKRA